MSENKILINHTNKTASRLDYLSVVSLLMLLFFVPITFYRYEYIWTKVFVIYIFFFPVLIAYFLRSILYKKIEFFYAPVLIPLILLDIAVLLSVFNAYNPHLSFQFIAKQIAYQGLFFFAIYYANNIKLRTVSIIIVIVSLIVSAYGLLQFSKIISSPLDLYGRPNPASTMGLTNFTTDYIVMVMPLLISLFFIESKSIIKYITYLGIILSLSYVLIGKNRAGWVALVFAAIYFVSLLNIYKVHSLFNRKIKRIILYTLTGIAAILLISVAFTKQGRELIYRGESIFNSSYPSNSFRILVWDSTLKELKDNPLLGVGIGNYEINIPLYEVKALKNTDWLELRYLNNAHNEYLQILFELGIVGLLLFLWFIIEIFITAFKSIKDAKDDTQNILWMIALSTGIVAALITAFFTFNLENPASSIMFWFFAGLIVGKRKYRYFEDEYGFISTLKKLTSFKWRWKYDFEIGMTHNYFLSVFYTGLLIIIVFLLSNLAGFSYKQAFADIYNTEAETYIDLKMPQKARNLLNKAYNLAPDDYMILYNRSRAEAGTRDYADAISDAKTVLRLNPYFYYGHKLLGFLYYKQDNFSGAISEFKKTIDLQPLSIKEIGPYLISAYLNTNNVNDALALALSLSKNNGDKDVYDFLIGTAYYMKADYQNAINYLKEATKENPSDFKAILNLTECLQKTNAYNDALKYALQLTKIEPHNPVAWYKLAQGYMLVKNEGAALDALATLFKINTSFKITVVNDGIFSKLLGRPKMKELLTGKAFVLPRRVPKRKH